MDFISDGANTAANMNTNGLPEPNNNNVKKTTVRKSSTARSKGKKVQIEEKPWYDVSDDDIEIRSPDPITSIISVRGSSSEDDSFI